MIRVRVLGQIAAEVGGAPADLGGRQQRGVLARLLVARGSVVSTDRIIDDLWRGEPPRRAIASLQAYVSNLRRAIEPDRPPRSPARMLVTAPPGYAIRTDVEAVDAWRFEHLLRSAQSVATATPPHARALLEDALGLWQGSAYAEFADERWAATEAGRLDELRWTAAESLVAVTLRCGRTAAAVPVAEALVTGHPLREESWRLLALAMWSNNRSAEALAALREARRVFATELGIDVAPALSELEHDILEQRTATLEAALDLDRARVVPRPHPDAAGRVEPFVGRENELAEMLGAAERVLAGRPRLVLVEGEPGIGKSSVLARLGQALMSQGWRVGHGRCPEDEGTPSAYAWTEALRVLDERRPAAVAAFVDACGDGSTWQSLAGSGDVAPGMDATEARFRLHRSVAAWLQEVAGQRPLAILLDDLHNADTGTLALLRHIANHADRARILLVAAFRPGDAGVREIVADLATRSPVRLTLAGLELSEVDRLVAGLYETPVDAATIKAIAERTGGNPFYVKETVHLLASEGELVATSEVPAGVRDVIRRRLARLPGTTVAVLRLASVAGVEFEVDVIVNAAREPQDRVLEALEGGVIAGLLREPAPGRSAFTHALARDTIYTDLTQVRRARLHGRVAAALSRVRPDDHPALAHHYARAASTETASRAVRHAVLAAERAERGHAHDSAVALLSQAVECHDMVPAGAGDRDADRIGLLARLLRAQVRAGALADARDTRDRAVDIARLAERDDLLIAALAAWTEPPPWIARPYGVVDRRTVDALDRLLHRTDLDPRTRCRLLASYVTELAGEGDPAADRAASEAVGYARDLDDPALLALALFEQARNLRWDRDAAHRARLADEIGRIAAEHHLTAYGWRAQYISATAAAARGDLAALSRHVDRGLVTARQHNLTEAFAVGLAARAMLAHIAGQVDSAERMYSDVCARLVRARSPHAAGFEALAMATIRASQARLAEYAPNAAALIESHGPPAVDVAAAALVAAGDHAGARALLVDPPALRPDFYFSIFATLRADAATALGRRDLAEDLYVALLPLHDQIAGAASTSLAMRPVAHTLASLAQLLGRTATAADHLAEAVTVAERWQAPTWRADAVRALAALRAAPRRQVGQSG